MKSVESDFRTPPATSAALPWIIQSPGSCTLGDWLQEHSDFTEQTLLEQGALLFRGFGVNSIDAFEAASTALCGDPLRYVYRSTPRTDLGRNIYTATEYPPNECIPLHNENAYQRDWPTKLVFCCVQPATTGGETSLARTAAVTKRIDPVLRSEFSHRGVMYVRNFGQGVDLPWETTFQTTSRREVEVYCSQEGIEWEWLDDDCLRTRQVCHAVAPHPRTGEVLWFNQAHLFHPASLGRERHATMVELFGEANLPRNACFGDGAPIPDSAVAQIQAAFDAETVLCKWERGDVLLVDNMLVSHGRRAFTGARKVLVTMGAPYSGCSGSPRGLNEARAEHPIGPGQ